MLAWIASLTSYSQPPKRSSSIPGLTSGITFTPLDSLVHVPHNKFRKMAANRVAVDGMRIDCVNEVSRLGDIVLDLKGELTTVTENRDNLKKENVEVSKNYADLNEKHMNANLDLNRLRPWATVGKIGVYGILTAGAVFGALEVIKTLKP
jgi:hypothetical protein